MRRIAVLLLLAAGVMRPGTAAEIDHTEFLPPAPPWEGNSRSLMVAGDDEWITPSELSGLTTTPRYAETVAWLERLCAAAPELELRSIGRSAEGRDIWMVDREREDGVHSLARRRLRDFGQAHCCWPTPASTPARSTARTRG